MVVEINVGPSPLMIRTVLVKEKAFGSVLELQVSDTGLISGKYYVPSMLSDAKVSHLSGRVVHMGADQWGITGCWQYSAEPFKSDIECGEFNMICKQEGFKGWFTEAKHTSKQPWLWDAPQALVSEVSAFVAPTVAQWNEQKEQEQDDSASRWFKTFHCVTAWFFLWMTAAALLLAVCDRASDMQSTVGIGLNLSFNLFYTVVYGSFITISASMSQRFSTLYTLGVLFYTGGYAFFVLLFLLAMFPGGTETSIEAQDIIFGLSPCRFFYCLGSTAFAMGSACLIHDMWPRNLSSASSTFGGSLLFLLGSLFFLADSTEPLWDTTQSIASSDLISEDLACLGYILFLGGRLAFLYGSIVALPPAPTSRRPKALSLDCASAA